MVSALFTDLYYKAVRREHPKLVTVMAAHHYLDHKGDLLHLGRAGEGIVAAAQDFDDRLAEVAMRQRMRVLPYLFSCPTCGHAYCPHAELALRVPPGFTPAQYMMYLLHGGNPYQYENLSGT